MFKRLLYLLTLGIFVSLTLVGCMAGAHKAAVQDNTTDRVTVGKVQREIRVGMSSADVVQVLGSPNMVSTDDQRREVWIYDKISTEYAYSSSSGGVGALILGFGSGGGGGGSVGMSGSSGASSSNQRTLTIVIKFDDVGKVRDYAYHTSSF